MQTQKTSQVVLRPLALVTGASSGLGREIATGLARRGFDLLLCARNGQALFELREELSASSAVHVQLFQGDLCRRDTRLELLALLAEQNAKVDVFVHAAGSIKTEMLLDGKLDDQLLQDEIHLRSLDHLLRGGILSRMLLEGNGYILLISSAAGILPLPGAARYSALKHAVLAYGLSLRAELPAKQITLTVACPGLIKTDLFKRAGLPEPRTKMMHPGDVAEKVLRALFARRPLWIRPRSLRIVASLTSLLPGFALDFMLKRIKLRLMEQFHSQ